MHIILGILFLTLIGAFVLIKEFREKVLVGCGLVMALSLTGLIAIIAFLALIVGVASYLGEDEPKIESRAPVSTPKPPTNPKPSAIPQPPAPDLQPSAEPKVTAPRSAIRPSFDCDRASLHQDLLVCSNNELALLDIELWQLYSKVGQQGSQQHEFRESQELWIAASRNACADAECLATAYRERIEELKSRNSPRPPPPPQEKIADADPVTKAIRELIASCSFDEGLYAHYSIDNNVSNTRHRYRNLPVQGSFRNTSPTGTVYGWKFLAHESIVSSNLALTPKVFEVIASQENSNSRRATLKWQPDQFGTSTLVFCELEN